VPSQLTSQLYLVPAAGGGLHGIFRQRGNLTYRYIHGSHAAGIVLQCDEKGRLQATWMDDRNKSMSYFIDYLGARFLDEDPHVSRTSPLFVAMGKKPIHEGTSLSPWVYDMTGGIGRDSVRLLNSGYRVVLHERNPVLVKLIEDALKRLYAAKPLYIDHIKFLPVDSCSYYSPTGEPSVLIEPHISCCPLPSVVYLDPMYDTGVVGRKAKVKKDTQLLHAANQPNLSSCNHANNVSLFETARRLCRQRVVVKRANRDAPLVGATPHESVAGKTHRYDIYFKSRVIKFT
jgi:hypothetical protein